MPFNRPTLAELIDRAAADIEAGLPGTDARLRRSNLNVLAKVHAGAMHGLYGYLDWLAKQLFVDTAEQAYLERHAALWGRLRLPAAFAEGSVQFSGTNGVVVPAGTAMQRGDGWAYETTADATISAGTATAPVIATTAGATGNAVAGTSLTLSEGLGGVASNATVAAGGITGGAEVEKDDALRARVVARIQQAPMGGAKADYVAWAKEVPGVTRAWVYPLEAGPGTVVVRFVRDDDASIIPDAGEVAAVQDHIDELRPVCAQVTALAPTAAPLDFDIALTPSTTAVRAAVQAELADLLKREAVPGGTILLSHLQEAIPVAAGETNHVLNSPSADVTHTSGQIATLGTFTWSP